MHNPLLTSRALLTKACLITVGVGLLGLAPGANARVTQLHITQTETPAYAGAEFGSPPIEIGVAAPRLVAGAIAAKWLAYRM